MTPHAGRPIRVLVVEDSPSMCQLLVGLLAADARFQVVGTARDGEQAVAQTAQLRPDVITMDLHLPRLDGVAATRRIMAETPTPIVVVSITSRDTPNGVAFEALQAGALTVLGKPPGPGDPRHATAAAELLTTIGLMAEVKVVRRSIANAGPDRRLGVLGSLRTGTGRASAREVPPASPPRAETARPLAIVLAASTGGPQAIQTVLQSLGGNLDVPLLVVQHMSPGFLDGMVAWLAATCPQPVRLAEHGERPTGGTVYVAPEDYHLLVTRRGTLALSKASPMGGFRPSANVLLESAAEHYAARAIGAVLTGMGEDGAAGLAALRAARATTLAQDEASSVVYGMPRAAVAIGAAEQVLPLTRIGPTIRSLLHLKPALLAADS